MRTLRFSIAVLAALLLALPASAGAVTFGANLDARTATSDTSCGYPPYYPFGYSPLDSSCTFFSTATPTGVAAETQVVPLPDPAIHGNQSGTITQVRIKTGAGSPGPAKLTVLRANRVINGGEAACCIGQAESAQFTLNPNTIVHVNTDLPVASTYDAASRIYSYDILALSVLDESTPIPAELSGDFNGYCSTGYFPYVQTGQERFSGEYNVCGYLVLMQADLTIHPSNTGGGGGGGGNGGGKFTVGKPRTLANGDVALTLNVPGPGRVVGKASADVPADLLARTSKQTKILVAKRKLNVSRAGKVKLVLKPRAAARKVLARRAELKAKAKLTFTPTSGASSSIRRSVTFR